MSDANDMGDIKKKLEGQNLFKNEHPKMVGGDHDLHPQGHHETKLIKEKPNFLDELKQKQKDKNLDKDI